MEISILQTDFIGSPQLLSQDSIIGDKNNCMECSESDFQEFLDKISEGININNSMQDKNVTDNANSEITTIDSMEISASLFLSMLGINPDIAKPNSTNIDVKSIGCKDLKSVTAVDFLKNLGFSEDNARGIVAQVVNTGQKLEGINKANGNTQILSQIDYEGSLNKNILPEGGQKNIPPDSVQIQKSLEDIKNIVSDKLELNPAEIESKFLIDKQDVTDKIFNKESVKENLKILNGFTDNNSLKTENEDVAINNKDGKVFRNLELIDKKESSLLDSEKTIDSRLRETFTSLLFIATSSFSVFKLLLSVKPFNIFRFSFTDSLLNILSVTSCLSIKNLDSISAGFSSNLSETIFLMSSKDFC